MKRTKGYPTPPAPLVWERADPKALAAFDVSTKICTMNCGPHRDDPRSKKERMFMCPECQDCLPGEGGG